MNNLYDELEVLTQKIENNTANLDDYNRYESILLQGGLSLDYIHSYLNRAGFRDWNDLVLARRSKEVEKSTNAGVIGAIIGLGLGLLIAELFGDRSE
ncbi:MAG: hypothetical protein ABJM06_00620 [Gilvibacter sp.]